jgi:hypothetical protein
MTGAVARIRDNLGGVPRGAIAVVVVGLLLSVVAAALTIDEDEGGERIEWELSAEIPSSRPASLESEGRLQIVDARIDATRDNASGYSLFRIAAIAVLDLGAFEGRSLARCEVRVPPRSVLARTPGKRAAYPLPSEDLRSQAVPELSVIHFNAKGSDLVGVEVEDAFGEFTNADPVKVEWAPYRQGEQAWEWVLEPAERSEPVRLAFMTMWRTPESAGARIACSATAGGESARTATSGGVG